ncbi:PSD1 and planctomycete cytochrome C domain-containing protein [Anatilimnocola floriformis]|uniref:PSD1 and planctomycete cytochrome C domain-containing protein n=1 Tax=Anatilimnocola floriformis TaxID=2948575 RepID=UPI0020C1C0E0|nr:PSD1 and planctomycete cytochrome C domain-containing protein [Anatilimnocola floriformis]
MVFWLRHSLSCAFGILAVISGAALADEPKATPEQERFFEEKVRPVLATKCWECHGTKKQESGLRLDSRASILKGGDSGKPAALAGDADKSLMIEALHHRGDVQMPPETKLPEGEIAAITDWVKQGLPWPAGSASASLALTAVQRAAADRQSHWAYQPVSPPAVPANVGGYHTNGPLDAFVAAKLQAAKLTQSPEADRRTLLRRLSFDLIGLPATSEEVMAFEQDAAPDAYERQVDRLLASPQLGARWGRHWLDVARYADTRGYAFQKDRRYPYAYTYRDYVIDSMNRDLPYDQFIREQLAADQLQLGDNKKPLAALGFLTTGRRFNNRNDDIDDQIDAVTRGILGLTVACARCHDHKFDAIPAEDYYSLYGVFASIEEPNELPLIAQPQESEAFQAFEAELNKRRTTMNDFIAAKHRETIDKSRQQTADYLARIAAGDRNVLLEKLTFLSLDPKDLRQPLVDRWKKFLAERTTNNEHALWGLWQELLALKDTDFAAEAPKVIERFAQRPEGVEKGQFNPLLKAAITAEQPATRMDVPRIYGKLLVATLGPWKDAGSNDEAINKLDAAQQQLARVLVAKESPTDLPATDTRNFLNRADRNQLDGLQKKVQEFEASSPVAPPRAMVVYDKKQLYDPKVFIRGNQARPGKPVPRQFLLVMNSAEQRQPFKQGSGRKELADALVSPSNPLTARVLVNRVWMNHFGEPIVNTPSDFGIRTEAPPLQNALDWLAAELPTHGWSMKDLHRQIVTSAAYRQQSNDRADAHQIDPENRLLWRMNRRRLEWEPLRDNLLAVSGRLDLAIHGKSVELTKAPFPRRRSVYGSLDRQDVPNLFRVFDIASPDSSSPRRPRTTVPQQALFLMNSPFVVEQAQALAQRPEVTAAENNSDKIQSLYRLVFGRAADDEERKIAEQFLSSTPPAGEGVKLNPLEQLAQLLLLTNEFTYVD